MDKYCQTNEEEIIDFIFNKIGVTNKYCVEFGAGDGYKYSNTRHLLEKGWNGLMMDAEHSDNKQIKHEFIVAENICRLFEKYDVPLEFDLLSIDIDGNDIYVLNALLNEYNPRVIIAEFNPAIPVGINKTIKYNAGHTWNNDDYYGASMEAFKKMGVAFGYNIIDNNGLNLFMLKNNIEWDRPFNDNYKERHDHATSSKTDWIEYKPKILI